MKNVIRSNGKIAKRRSKNLNEGEIQCLTCGTWITVSKFVDKHFNEIFYCKSCKKEQQEEDKKVDIKPKKKKQQRPQFPDNCPHRPFFGCNSSRWCQGCYYNPDEKIALMTKFGYDSDEVKTSKTHWFYSDKNHAKKLLALLEDIKQGRGLLKGGNRSWFKYARKNKDDDEE